MKLSGSACGHCGQYLKEKELCFCADARLEVANARIEELEKRAVPASTHWVGFEVGGHEAEVYGPVEDGDPWSWRLIPYRFGLSGEDGEAEDRQAAIRAAEEAAK